MNNTSYAENVFKYAIAFYTYSCEMLSNVSGVSYSLETRTSMSDIYPKLERFHIEYAVRYMAILQRCTIQMPASNYDIKTAERVHASLYDMIHRVAGKKPMFELTVDADIYLTRWMQIRDHTEPGTVTIADMLRVVELIYECGVKTCHQHLGKNTYLLDAYHFAQAVSLMNPRIGGDVVDFRSRSITAVENEIAGVRGCPQAIRDFEASDVISGWTTEAIAHYTAYIDAANVKQ